MKVLLLISLVSVAVHSLPTSSFSVENRIAGGHAAEEGQFPFQVGVQTRYLDKEKNEYTTWCGGSLISDRVVLTAAHCVKNGIYTQIALGAINVLEDPLVIDVGTEGMIIHEDYNRFGDNDIALVILPEPVTFNDKIQPVNLPRRSQKDMTFEETVGWISGWGFIGDGKGSTEILQWARRWILPHVNCEYHFGGAFKKDTQVCVDGSHGISACQGDSGGPLTIVEVDGSRTLVGCTSYGKFVCEKGYPSVYTRVTAYLDWISEKSGIPIRD